MMTTVQASEVFKMGKQKKPRLIFVLITANMSNVTKSAIGDYWVLQRVGFPETYYLNLLLNKQNKNKVFLNIIFS